MVFAGLPHHITQRGNRGADVFFSDADRTTYLDWLREYCGHNGVQILAYCLMTNHVHIVATPCASDGLAKVFRPLHSRYALRVNRVQNWNGHFWQGRYFSSTLDEAYLWAAIRYVERNPVRAGMVDAAEDYHWSSARGHCGLREDPVLTRNPEWLSQLESMTDWSNWLVGVDPPIQLDQLRQQVVRGLPCGDESFIRELEQRAGRALEARSRGRPGKASKEPPSLFR
jgi:putative transposase